MLIVNILFVPNVLTHVLCLRSSACCPGALRHCGPLLPGSRVQLTVSTELAVSLIEEYRGHRVVGMELANEVISDQYRRVTGRAKPRFFV